MNAVESGEWTISAELAGKTLSAALKTLYPNQSWSQVRRILSSRRVSINDTLAIDEARRLIAGDHVVVSDRPQPSPPDDKDVSLVHMDEELIVADKPSGMISLRHVQEIHWPAARRRRQPSLDEVLLRVIAQHDRHRHDLSSQPPKIRRRHLRSVHRIDRGTSGLLVFARTRKAEDSLVQQFSTHAIERTYLTVVAGQPAIGEIRSRLIRDRGDGLRGSTDSAQDGKSAVTHIRQVESLGEYSIVTCQLETGRTHQIRIHLAEAGYPVCGDAVYRGRIGSDQVADSSGSTRLALHATELGLSHPITGHRLTFRSEMPPELTQLVEKLRHS